MSLECDGEQLDFPVVYASAKMVLPSCSWSTSGGDENLLHREAHPSTARGGWRIFKMLWPISIIRITSDESLRQDRRRQSQSRRSCGLYACPCGKTSGQGHGDFPLHRSSALQIQRRSGAISSASRDLKMCHLANDHRPRRPRSIALQTIDPRRFKWISRSTMDARRHDGKLVTARHN